MSDIKNMQMFADGTFGIIMSQFYHHFQSFEFDEFVNEARSVLAPGGHFAFEPNIMEPVCFAACTGKKFFGNVTGAVKDESPYFQPRLTASLKRCGFESVWLRAGSFSYNRMPIFLARIIHVVTRQFLRVPGVRLFGWYCTVHGRKPL